MKTSHATIEADTEVVVIGNGPAGLSVSAFLSGVLPFYNSSHPHHNPNVHKRLRRKELMSLLDQDLSWFNCVDDRGLRPISQLYDSLARPVDSSQSSLRWIHDPSLTVPHVVLGATPVGGSWSTFDPEMLAVSIGGWLDLPAFPISAYLGSTMSERRIPASIISAYMKAYTEKLGMADHIQPGTTVTRISKQENGVWLVEGEHSDGSAFSLTCRKIVVATGKMQSRLLQVEGESQCTRVVYDVRSLKDRMANQEESSTVSRVIVVGDGVSSADAVTYCMERGVEVVHVMKKGESALRNSSMSNMSSSVYPEYNRVHRLMTGRARDALYTRHTAATVLSVHNHPKGWAVVRLRTAKGHIVEERCSFIAACVGKKSTLVGVMPDDMEIGNDYITPYDNVYCVGSAAGDHFVRFLIGGCLQVAQCIVSEYRGSKNCVRRRSTVTEVETLPQSSIDSFLEDSDSLPLQVSC